MYFVKMASRFFGGGGQSSHIFGIKVNDKVLVLAKAIYDLAVEYSAHDWNLEGRGIDPCPMLDGSGVKAMPGSIPAPKILVHSILEKKENIGSRMVHTKK